MNLFTKYSVLLSSALSLFVPATLSAMPVIEKSKQAVVESNHQLIAKASSLAPYQEVKFQHGVF